MDYMTSRKCGLAADKGVFEVDSGEYRTLTVEKSGHCLIADIPDSAEASVPVSQIASDLAELCGQIAWMEDIRVVLLAFNGVMNDSDSRDGDRKNGTLRLTEPVAGLNQPVIAAIRGDALGLGLELALACDIRVCAESTCFGMPQVCHGGIPANGGTQRLPRLIGPGPAMHMILTGESIDSGEAYRIGLVHSVVASDLVMQSAQEIAQQMATKSPLSLSYAKEALYSAGDLTLDQGLNKEMDLYLLLHSTDDRTEGITAFTEKRKPDFKGI
jgi:enoyl-CoA hydratase/carnithine racemase